MPRRKSISGVIDPISLIGVLLLIVTLVVGTKVTNDRSMSLNISEKAADCFDECRQDSGRKKCNSQCGTNINWKGENVIDTSKVDKGADPKDPTCDANGVQYSAGAVVMYGGIGSNATCGSDGKWDVGVGATIDIKPENVPEYAKGTDKLEKQIEAEKQAAEQLATEQQTVTPQPTSTISTAEQENLNREKSQCLQEGGSWFANICSYTQQEQAIAKLVPIIEKQECEAQGKVLVNGECISAQSFITVERDETGTTRDLVTIYRDEQNNVVGSDIVPNITIQNTQTVEKDAASNGRSLTTYNTIIRDSDNNIVTYNSIPTYTESFKNVEKVDDGFVRDFTTVLRNQNTNEILNAITQSIHTKDLAQVVQPTTNTQQTHNFADCNREGLTSDQTAECNRKLSKVYNAPIIGRFLEDYRPENVDYTWQENGYSSYVDCLANIGGSNGHTLKNCYVIKNEQIASSVQLGTTITALAALPIAGGAYTTGAITGYQAIALAMATSTMYQTGSAVDICVTAPDSPECKNAKLWAGVSWVNVGSSGLANAYQASKLAQGINTAVNVANVGADALDISQSCGDGQFASNFGCVAAWGGLVFDVGQGGVDIARVINNNLSGLSGNLGSLPDVNSNIVPDTNKFFATNPSELGLITDLEAKSKPVDMLFAPATQNFLAQAIPNAPKIDIPDINGTRIANAEELALFAKMNSQNTPKVDIPMVEISAAKPVKPADVVAEIDIPKTLDTPSAPKKTFTENLFGEPKTKKFSNVKTGETILIKPGDTIRTGNFETKMPKPDEYPDGIFWTKNPGDTPQRLTSEGVPITKGNSAENINFTDVNGKPINDFAGGGNAITLTDEVSVQTTITRAKPEQGLLSVSGFTKAWDDNVVKPLGDFLFGNPVPKNIDAPINDLLPPSKVEPSFFEKLTNDIKPMTNELTGMDVTNPKLAEKIYTDQASIRKKYNLPDYTLRETNPEQHLNDLKNIALENKVEVKDISEYPEFFKENPHAGAVHFSPGDKYNPTNNHVVALNLSEVNETSLAQFEHELVHALQPSDMPIEIKEYEAYLTQYAGKNYDNTGARVELFGMNIYTSTNTGYQLIGQKMPERLTASADISKLPVEKITIPQKFTNWWDETFTNPIINSPVGDFLFGKPTFENAEVSIINYLDNNKIIIGNNSNNGNGKILIVDLNNDPDLRKLIDNSNEYLANVAKDEGLTTSEGLTNFVNDQFSEYNTSKITETVDNVLKQELQLYTDNPEGIVIGQFIKLKCAVCREQSTMLHVLMATNNIDSKIVLINLGSQNHAYVEFIDDVGREMIADPVLGFVLPKNEAFTRYSGTTNKQTEIVGEIIVTRPQTPVNTRVATNKNLTITTSTSPLTGFAKFQNDFTNWVKTEMAKTNPNAFKNIGFELRSPISADGKLQLPFEKATTTPQTTQKIEELIDKVDSLVQKDIQGVVPIKNYVPEYGCKAGLCGLSSDYVGIAAPSYGLEPKEFQIQDLNISRGLTAENAFRHAATVVKDTNGDFYLIDDTFIQFVDEKTGAIRQLGWARRDGVTVTTGLTKDNPVAQELLTKGYIKLTPETLGEYLNLTSSGSTQPLKDLDILLIPTSKFTITPADTVEGIVPPELLPTLPQSKSTTIFGYELRSPIGTDGKLQLPFGKAEAVIPISPSPPVTTLTKVQEQAGTVVKNVLDGSFSTGVGFSPLKYVAGGIASAVFLDDYFDLRIMDKIMSLFPTPEITTIEQMQLDNQHKDTQDLKTNVNTVVTTTVAVQPQAENNIQLESQKFQPKIYKTNETLTFAENYKELPKSTFSKELITPTKIVIHWDGNANYDDPSKWTTSTTYNGLVGRNTSSHFAVGVDGVIQFVPMTENKVSKTWAYSGEPDVINIEFGGAHFDKVKPSYYETQEGIKLIASLIIQYDLDITDIIGHRDNEPNPEFVEMLQTEVDKLINM